MISNALKCSSLGHKVLRHQHFYSRIIFLSHCRPHVLDVRVHNVIPHKVAINCQQVRTHSFKHSSLKSLQTLLLRTNNRHDLNFFKSQIPACAFVNLRISSRDAHSSNHPNPNECEPKKKSRGGYYFAGAVLIFSGIVGYAKYDDEFRRKLDELIPGSSDFIAIIFQEEESYLDHVSHALDKIKDTIADVINTIFGGGSGPSSGPDKTSSSKSKSKSKAAVTPPCDEEQKPYKPPRPAFKSLLGDEKKDDLKFTERRALTPPPDNSVIQIAREPEPQEVKPEEIVYDSESTNPQDLVDLETRMGNAAQIAIKNYTDAICVLRDHAEEIYKLVESSVEKVDPKIWPQIKEKSEEKEELVKEAEMNAKIAEQSIDTLKQSIENPKLAAPAETKERAKKNMKKVLDDVAQAKKAFEKEKSKASVTEKYWSKVEEARSHFSEEIEILFPNVRLSDKQLKLAEGEIDLFILYAFQNILFYQKEVSKLETIGQERIKQAVEQSKVGDPDVIKSAMEAELEIEKSKLQQEYQKRSLELKAEFEKDIRSQLKRQAEAHNDHLNEAIALKEKEVERKLARKVEEKVLEERTKFKEELAGMISRLKGLDEAIKKRADQDKYAQQSQVLWSACQTLVSALKSSDVNKPASSQLKPLEDEIKAICKAGEKDELVDTIVKSIPQEALDRGIYSEDALRERFLHVERVASIVAIVPEDGASLPLILLSYLQNMLTIKYPIPIPAHELANEPFDPTALSTFDILQRARFWMDRGDIAQTLRYMNLLQGGARAVACDWIREAQIMLETQQAANVLLTHASASGLVYS